MAVVPAGVTFDVRKWVVLSRGGRGCAESGETWEEGNGARVRGMTQKGRRRAPRVWVGGGLDSPGAGSDIVPSNQQFDCSDYVFFL